MCAVTYCPTVHAHDRCPTKAVIDTKTTRHQANKCRHNKEEGNTRQGTHNVRTRQESYVLIN